MNRYIYNLLIIFFVLIGERASALEDPAKAEVELSLATKLGASVDLGLTFSNSNGQDVALRDFIKEKRPLLIVPGYYGCPRLCGLVLDGLTKALNKLTLNLGEDFTVVVVSFDKTEGYLLAEERAKQYRPQYRDPAQAEQGWQFLSSKGHGQNIDLLMQQLGFKYKEDGGEFAHSAAIIALTPEGKISQYLTGIHFSPVDLRLSLVEASQGEIGSPIDHVLMFCYRFDPTKGKYTWAAFNLLRVGGFVTLLVLIFLILKLKRSEKKQAN